VAKAAFRKADSLIGAAQASCVTGLREGVDPSTNNKHSSANMKAKPT